MKVYVVVEEFTENCFRDENVVITNISSAHETHDGAVSAIRKLRDSTWDEITDCDENKTSRISVDNEWNGSCCELVSDSCQRWKWTIKELCVEK